MPYIAFDLDALKHVPDAARSAGVPEEAIGYGLVRLWAYCWTEKTDTVTATHLTGFFGTDKASAALVAFGHLELVGVNFRVRGAEKYLRITAAQSAAGRAKAGNLRRGATRRTAGSESEPTRDPPGDPPGDPPPGSPRLLHRAPSTEHRAPSTEYSPPASQPALFETASKPVPKAPKAEKPLPDPGWQDLVDSIDVHWLQAKRAKYLWTAPDFAALKRLRKTASDEEITTRWLRGLHGTYAREVNSVAQLASGTKWNALATDEPTKQSNVAATPDSYWDSIPEGGREVKL